MSDTDDAAAGLERKLATILSADVAGYSRLMAEDEEQTLRTFRGHKEVFEKLVALHRGRVFNTAGDAILAEFGSAVEAVRCATEIQAALRTRNDQLPEPRQVRFRIGVNLGDVMPQGADLLGDGVNVAARLQSAAEPGGVCISGSVYDQIRNKLSLSFKPLGEMSFKNIPYGVRTFAIAGGDGLGTLPFSLAVGRQHRRGIAALKAIIVALFVIAVGGGALLWGYSEYRQRAAEIAREAQLAQQQQAAERAEAERRAAEAAQQKAAAEAKARAAEEARLQGEAERRAAEQKAALEAERRAAEVARQQAAAERRQFEESLRRLAEGQRKTADPPARQAALAPPGRGLEPPSAPAAPRAAGDRDGIYGGRVCYGPSPADPARCYRAQAILREGKISGQWPGRDAGVTVYLAGDIGPTGDVTLHMHSTHADGSRLGVGDLAGTLQNGQIDAKGAFLNGRSVTLNWRKF